MKTLLLPALLSSLLSAQGFEYKGNIGFESAYIKHDIIGKRDKQLNFRGEVEFKQKFANEQFVFSAKSIVDTQDVGRRYVEVTDAYYKHAFENSDILIGRNTRFWGAMEFYNHTDNFNTKDLRDDPFDYDSKLGAWNLAYTYYTQNAEIALIIKARQERQQVQEQKSINNFFPALYKEHLQTKESKNRPTVYLKYTGSSEVIQLDYSLVYQNGYDEQRYLSFKGNELVQNAYLVNKLMGYATYVNAATIYKTELAYTLSDDTLVSDYAQMSFGLEHTLYGVVGKADLGLLVEYYRYWQKEKGKLNVSNFGNLYADDISLGFRISLNDGQDSSVLGGFSIDRGNKEKIFFMEYETRWFDSVKTEFSYQHLAPKNNSLFQELDRVSLAVGYYF